jgi:hypothetical protein
MKIIILWGIWKLPYSEILYMSKSVNYFLLFSRISGRFRIIDKTEPSEDASLVFTHLCFICILTTRKFCPVVCHFYLCEAFYVDGFCCGVILLFHRS